MESEVIEKIKFLSTEEQNELLFSELRHERELNRCFRLMHGAEELTSVMEQVLGTSCAYLRADTGLYFTVKSGLLTLDKKWSAYGDEEENSAAAGAGAVFSGHLSARLFSEDVILVENEAEMGKDCIALFGKLCGKDIKSALFMPVKVEGGLCACMAYCNARISYGDSFRFLSSLARYISISAEREKKRRTLAELSYTDALTGCLNRTKFYEDVTYLAKQRGVSAGVIYVDVNGLKKVNDVYAHEAGDELLRECADILIENCPGSQVYRVGGDEFVVLESGVPNGLFEVCVNHVRDVFDNSARCNVALGSSWMSDTGDIEEHVSIADREMYRNKREYYCAAENDRRSQR